MGRPVVSGDESKPGAPGTAMGVLVALSVSHMLNDTSQSLIPALYPLLKDSFRLDYGQVGMITLAFQLTGSLLQPFVGFYTDRRPKPYSLAIGMGFTLVGLVLLSLAGTYPEIILAAALTGVGSAIFHPEASRVAKMASGGRHGFAQALFQVGGNLGSSLGPLLAATVVIARGQREVLWFSLMALAGIVVLTRVGHWYRLHPRRIEAPVRRAGHPELPRRTTVLAIAILLSLVFSKYFYLVSLTNYYTFFLISKFHVSSHQALIYLFVFLFAVAAGTIIGGPIGDRFGRKYVIWVSILGVAPFTLILPHVDLAWTVFLSIVIGLVLSSAFSAILVYAQELLPGRTGLVAGLFFGFAFGIAGVGSAYLGNLADRTSIFHVFEICSVLPLIGLLTGFLPNLGSSRKVF
jgi:FSR family fosmidomycin resistance protein-like MFS transporter